MTPETSEDWLSRTIHMVDTVMVHHGWVDDEPKKQTPELPVVTQNKRREWIKRLASTLRMQKAVPL